MFPKTHLSRLKSAIISLGIAVIALIMVVSLWGTPLSAQSNSRFSLTQPSNRILSFGDIQFTSVNLDGLSLFQVASPKFFPSESELEGNLSPIERRVRRIEGNLHHIINSGFNPQTLEVRPSILNNLTVIVASDGGNLAQQVILTVNEMDAQLNSSSVADLAQQWSQIIHQGLIQAWQQRQPAARQRQISRGVIFALGIILISCLLFWSQKILQKRFNRLKKAVKEQVSNSLELAELPIVEGSAQFFPEPLALLSAFRQQANLQQKLIINLFLQRLDKIGLIILWFIGVSAILHTFPETRLQGRSLIGIPLRIFIIWLVLTLISNLASLYVNDKLREWVEEAEVVSEDSQRRILRAPTLLEVLRGIIGFASWCVGIIWFLLWKGLFPTSFLTGAGLLGAALTFSFRDLCKDWIVGILIILEDQYAVGDMIEFEGAVGIVEHMSLRATQIRGADGRLSTISHNQITVAHNLSKDWSRVNFMIEVAYNSDVNTAIALMKEVAQEMAEEAPWQDDIIDPVNVIGVSRVTHAGIEIMMRIRVKRLRQWDIEREFRRRLKLAFDQKGIQIGVPQQSFLF